MTTTHIVVSMKPTNGTFNDNFFYHSVSGLHIDDTRIAGEVPTTGQGTSDSIYGGGQGLRPTELGVQQFSPHNQGRFPTNLIHDGSPEVLIVFNDSTKYPQGRGNTNATKHGGGNIFRELSNREPEHYDHCKDEGSVARFFKAL